MDDSEGSGTIVDDWGNGNRTQENPSPLVVQNELVARRTADELLFIDATTLKTIDRVSEQYASTCLFQKAQLLAFTSPDKTCEIDVFEGRTLVKSLPFGECAPRVAWRIVDAGRSKVYVTDGYGGLLRYQLANGVLTKDAAVPVSEEANGGFDQLLGFGDGRVLIPAGRALHAYGGAEPQEYKAAGPITHLCLATPGRIWYSVHDREGWANQIMLAQLGSTLTSKSTVSVAPGRVTHMASDPDGSLAVVTSVVPTNIGGWRPAILLLDPKGAEQRRIVLDDSVMDVLDADLNAAFVALTPTVIVLDAGRHGVFGWNRSTGARI